MRPIPIPDAYLEEWQAVDPGSTRRILGAPITGDLTDDTIAPLEVVFHPVDLYGEKLVGSSSLWVPDADDRTVFPRNLQVEVTIYLGSVPPLSLRIRHAD